MDFITDLPDGEGYRNLWVIKDRLSKTVILQPTASMEAEECAEQFLWCYARYHWWPRSIVSDRGTNWTSRFWQHLCKLLRIKQKLSTAYHPQTDGGPERMNQEVEAFLRAYIDQNQQDWAKWVPIAMMAINARINSSIGMSPFFATHGYHPEPVIPLSFAVMAENHRPSDPETAAKGFVEKMQ